MRRAENAFLIAFVMVISVVATVATLYAVYYHDKYEQSRNPAATGPRPLEPLMHPVYSTVLAAADPSGYIACEHLSYMNSTPSKREYIRELWIAGAWAMDSSTVEIKAVVYDKNGLPTMPPDPSDFKAACEHWDFPIPESPIK